MATRSALLPVAGGGCWRWAERPCGFMSSARAERSVAVASLHRHRGRVARCGTDPGKRCHCNNRPILLRTARHERCSYALDARIAAARARGPGRHIENEPGYRRTNPTLRVVAAARPLRRQDQPESRLQPALTGRRSSMRGFPKRVRDASRAAPDSSRCCALPATRWSRRSSRLVVIR